jgi:sugar phosphate isomerase/epimerase
MSAANQLNIADFGMDTSSLAGSLAHKLEAVRGAGFTQVMLTARDLVSHPDGVDAAIRVVKDSGLRVSGFQALRDYEGLTGHLHEYKIDMAKSLLEMCRAVGAELLLVSSSTSAHASGNADLMARDLRKLAMLAVPSRVRIGYEALSWGHHVKDFFAAWDIVCRADAPNLGLVVDSFHALASAVALDDMDMLDPDKVFLVQLADFMWHSVDSTEERIDAAGHFRVFPGEGVHSQALSELVLRLSKLGYRGDYSFEVFNDDYQQLPLPTVAERARRSAVWLSEDVLHLSTPLPGRMRLRNP